MGIKDSSCPIYQIMRKIHGLQYTIIKERFRQSTGDKKKDAIEQVKKVCNYFNDTIYKSNKFSFPIDPTFLGIRFTDNVQVFKSKMVPVRP